MYRHLTKYWAHLLVIHLPLKCYLITQSGFGFYAVTGQEAWPQTAHTLDTICCNFSPPVGATDHWTPTRPETWTGSSHRPSSAWTGHTMAVKVWHKTSSDRTLSCNTVHLRCVNAVTLKELHLHCQWKSLKAQTNSGLGLLNSKVKQHVSDPSVRTQNVS